MPGEPAAAAPGPDARLERAGYVEQAETWRDRALAAEARVSELERAVDEAVRQLGHDLPQSAAMTLLQARVGQEWRPERA